MRRKVVVVERPSPSNSTAPIPCWNCQSTQVALPFCEACGKVQELPASFGPFDILHEPLSLRIDEAGLRDKYFAISKRVHPDRFVDANPRETLYATRWSRALNRSYSPLRTTASRAEAILEHFNQDSLLKKGNVPVDLAEDYFEFQERVSENPSPEKWAPFLERLHAHREAAQQKRENFEAITTWHNRDLKALADWITYQRYLDSMENDIKRRM